MFKKLILSAFAATALMVASQAPASAAMAVAKPAVEATEATSNLVEVRNGRRRGGGFHRSGGRRWGGGRHWGGHRWHRRHYWRRHWDYAYRECFWRRGRKICFFD